MLAIDTSTSMVGAALLGDGSDPFTARAEGPRAQTELLAPLVEQVLARAGAGASDLTDVAVGTGPGPFTGLRVGMVTAVTMGHALGIPVYGVCSLDVLAEQAAARTGGDLLVATDARRREVYWARYVASDGHARRTTDPAVDRPADLPAEVRALPTAGRGPVLYPEVLTAGLGEPELLDVDPAELGLLALRRLDEGVEMPVEPLYLRRPDALTTAERATR
jgi:tRNA threonylcarbamoyladenosine biosynthesis protein TsaB